MERLNEYLQGRQPAVDLPLDIRATAFQLIVWRYLRTIPRGHVATYGEVAKGVGRPTAVRAVARACATNRVAVAIPCHRVIRSSGDPGGYRWGARRKRALLELEGAVRTA
jgi:AraC family transcriptional regulator of adaptative response/methylated-DNA-[protein]-cysteine methyltransferase